MQNLSQLSNTIFQTTDLKDWGLKPKAPRPRTAALQIVLDPVDLALTLLYETRL